LVTSKFTACDPLSLWSIFTKNHVRCVHVAFGAVHKRRLQSGEEGNFVQYWHFADKGGGGFFRCGRPHFLAQKTSDFSKFMMCPHGQEGRGGLRQCGHFADKEVGVNFS